MTVLTHVALRTPDQLPPVISSQEVYGLLNGTLTLPDPTSLAGPMSELLEEAEYERLFGRQPTSTMDLPDARIWVQRFTIALIECLSARRHPNQLLKFCEPDVHSRILRRYRAATRRGITPGPTGVRRVRVCLPADGVVEAAAVTRINGRPTPIAMRLTGADGRWRVSVLELP